MSTDVRPLSWLDLAPWHNQDAMDYNPDGYMPDCGDYALFEIDGVEYVTDRYVIVRRDLLDGEPSSWQTPFPAPPDPDRLRALVTPAGDPGTTWLAPLYLDVAERLGVTPIADGGRWFLRDDDGLLLAVITGWCPTDENRATLPPMLPGYDLTRARVVVGHLDHDLGARQRWWQAVTVIAELDALTTPKETDR